VLILVIVIIGVLVVVGGGGAAVWFFALGGGQSTETLPSSYERQVDSAPVTSHVFDYQDGHDFCGQLLLEPVSSVVAIAETRESTAGSTGTGTGTFTCRLGLLSEDRYEGVVTGAFGMWLTIHESEANAQTSNGYDMDYQQSGGTVGQPVEGLGAEAYSFVTVEADTNKANVIAVSGNVSLSVQYIFMATDIQPLASDAMINVMTDIANDALAKL